MERQEISVIRYGDTIEYKRPFIKDGKDLGGGVLARCHGPYCSFHVEFEQWSHNLAKWYKEEFERIKEDLKLLDVKIIFAATHDIEDKSWDKMVKFFGFSDPEINKTCAVGVDDV